MKDEIKLEKINKLVINENSFFITVICTNKSAIINTDEDDKFRFFIDLKDYTGYIRILGFKKNHDAFYKQNIKNEVYKIINQDVKKLNTKFNSVGIKCELRFNNKTIIEKCNSSISIVKNEQINGN